MLFSSITFLYYFLPIVLLLYFVAPKKMKNLVLFIVSIVFYFFGEPIYSLLMLGSSLSGYLHGLWIEKARNGKHPKIPLISSIVISIGLLGFFKYSDFFVSNINGIFKTNIGLLHLALPIGISFFTFQILSYNIDLYRGDAVVQKSFINFATYVTLFPQLIAGPIVRYTTIANQLDSREHSFAKFSSGVSRFVIGLSKKVLIANTLGEIGLAFSKSGNKSVLFYWLAAVAFMLHIYFDFSGYSDMAIGLGRMFGFDFNENFNYPYVSKSVTEFWRRWHISLGTWFRDYVYIPLGGNRCGKARQIFNILVVWLLTGFWHGAEWNFILWGLYFALFLIIEKLFLKKLLDKIPALGFVYTAIVVLFGWVLFNANNMGEVVANFLGMFGGNNSAVVDNSEALYYLKSYSLIFIMALVGATPLLKNIVTKIKSNEVGTKVINILEPIYIAVLIVLVTAYLVDGSFNPFLYFRF